VSATCAGCSESETACGYRNHDSSDGAPGEERAQHPHRKSLGPRAKDVLTPKEELERGARRRSAPPPADFGSAGGDAGLRKPARPMGGAALRQAPPPVQEEEETGDGGQAALEGLSRSFVVNGANLSCLIANEFACRGCGVPGFLVPEAPERIYGGHGMVLQFKCWDCGHAARRAPAGRQPGPAIPGAAPSRA